jgi:hypothetical protein
MDSRDHRPHLEYNGTSARRWTIIGFMKDEWIKKVSDGRLVQFTYLELAEGGVFTKCIGACAARTNEGNHGKS